MKIFLKSNTARGDGLVLRGGGVIGTRGGGLVGPGVVGELVHRGGGVIVAKRWWAGWGQVWWAVGCLGQGVVSGRVCWGLGVVH